MHIEVNGLKCICKKKKDYIFIYDSYGIDKDGVYYNCICFQCGNKIKAHLNKYKIKYKNSNGEIIIIDKRD